MAELATSLNDVGRPILLSALSKIEKEQRRVDVDDLVALALVLEVTPNALLLPDQADRTAPVQLTPVTAMTSREVWDWATRDRPLPVGKYGEVFVSYSSRDGKGWAHWTAAQLVRAGYHVMIDTWDLRPGMDFHDYTRNAVSRASCLVAIMTHEYFKSEWPQRELELAATSAETKILPLRVGQSTPEGHLSRLQWLDITNIDEKAASQRLLEALEHMGLPVRREQTPAPWPGRW
ncbi:MAG: TIR domain-containing protein [Actinomycetota bacterium]|nr:TIR domain-containing protein [Actinomycetota bacterium]